MYRKYQIKNTLWETQKVQLLIQTAFLFRNPTVDDILSGSLSPSARIENIIILILFEKRGLFSYICDNQLLNLILFSMKKLLLSLIFPVAFIAILAFSTGSPGGLTGSPGDGNANCTQCHSGTPNAVDNWIATNIPSAGYIPGQTYVLTATGTHPGVSLFGFEMTSEDESGNKVGSMVITNDTETQLADGGASITHTSQGSTPSGDSKSWQCDWIAPIDVDGPITFYASFNAANGNGSNSGDIIYLSSTTVNKDLTFISDLETNQNFWIYPNPVKEKFSIVIPQCIGCEVKIYDMTGQVIKRAVVNKRQTEFSIEGEKAGLYFVEISGDGFHLTRRIIKAH